MASSEPETELPIERQCFAHVADKKGRYEPLAKAHWCRHAILLRLTVCL